MESARRRNDEGFSLIELCIAAGIMAVAFLFIIGGVVDASNSNSVVNTRMLAHAQLVSTLEQLRGMAFNTMVASTPVQVDGLGASAATTLQAVNAAGVSGLVLPTPTPRPTFA
ncbi:MAG: hypothetical protein FJY92_05810 [Candidatus Hydrogenedentes bacterium]|nr:hypothetical protein [Candidatus Hydrogenedentota bacterium]